MTRYHLMLLGYWLVLSDCLSPSQVMDKPPLAPPEESPHYFVSDDGLRLYYKEFPARGDMAGIVAVAPGIGGMRKADFDAFGKYLSERGFHVYVLHPRGTGYSDGRRGDIEDFHLILDDFERFLERIRRDYPRARLYIVGASLGGVTAVQIAADMHEKPAGVILVNPAYKYSSRSGPSVWLYITYAFNYLFRPSALTVDMIGDPGRITHPEDRKEAEARLHDPLIVKKFSMRYMAGARKVMMKAPENAGLLDMPLLLIYGEDDEIIDHSGSEEIYRVWKCPEKKKVIIKAGHGTHAVNMSLGTIVQWLEDLHSNREKTS